MPLKVGVIGAGGIARLRHLPAFKDAERAGKVELVAVADAIEASAREAAERFEVPHAFADYKELLALPLDVVSVCTPNVHHEPISLAAIASGKHVLCEKPLAMTYAGARRMVEAAEGAGVRTAVNFRYRWVPAAGFARDLIRNGELGEVRHVFANYFNGSMNDPATPIRWRQTRADAGSGALGDLASHLVDMVRFWLGEIASVTGHLRTFVSERPLVDGGTGTVDTDDSTTFHAALASGAEAVFNASRVALGRTNHQRIEVYGTKGALVYEIEQWDQGGEHLQVCFGPIQARTAGFAPARVPPAYLAGHPQRPMLDFVDLILTGKEPSAIPIPTFEDGARCQEILDAVELSARDGTRVALPLGR